MRPPTSNPTDTTAPAPPRPSASTRASAPAVPPAGGGDRPVVARAVSACPPGRRPTWRTEAACLDEDTERFFPGRLDADEAALQACRRCPVWEECLREGLEEPFGVWGGYATRDRARFRSGALPWPEAAGLQMPLPRRNVRRGPRDEGPTRGEILAALRNADYDGPVSYTKPRLLEVYEAVVSQAS